MTNKFNSALPDVITQSGNQQGASLQWVGMEDIAIPIYIAQANGENVATTAKVNCYVSLDAGVKGIHMSRLYLLLNRDLAKQVVEPERIHYLLRQILQSHADISHSARVEISFDLPLQKPALLSDNYGYQSYQVKIDAILRDTLQQTLHITIPYSSTCPCSASLARQLVAANIDQHFSADTLDKAELLEWMLSHQGSYATPHNQRSFAYIELELGADYSPNLQVLITQLEQAIGTPVQTAVKREDEQAFAKLNGANLMFCEDAARRLKKFLNAQADIADFQFKIEHQESLHAHNAVAIDRKFPKSN